VKRALRVGRPRIQERRLSSRTLKKSSPSPDGIGQKGRRDNEHNLIDFPFVIANIALTTRLPYLVSNETETERSVCFTWFIRPNAMNKELLRASDTLS
jgi:hypothetical protein